MPRRLYDATTAHMGGIVCQLAGGTDDYIAAQIGELVRPTHPPHPTPPHPPSHNTRAQTTRTHGRKHTHKHTHTHMHTRAHSPKLCRRVHTAWQQLRIVDCRYTASLYMALASLLIAPNGSAELAGKRLLLFSFGTYPCPNVPSGWRSSTIPRLVPALPDGDACALTPRCAERDRGGAARVPLLDIRFWCDVHTLYR